MKRFNLLFDSWIPVKTRNGENKPIKAYEIVQKDIIALDAPRADFNAALMQFLIGLLQTIMAPKNSREWRLLFKNPPSKEELKFKFESIQEAFYLNGDGYRFMQDASIQNKDNLKPIEEIIFGGPGDNTKKKNVDHFVKNQSIKGLCLSCSASAILTANIFADNGGPGYFESMRGNGFISNLVCIDEEKGSGKENNLEALLWKNLWLNILPNDYLKGDLNKETFLWSTDTPDCDEKRKKLTLNIRGLDEKLKSTTDKKAKKDLIGEKKQAQRDRKNLTTIYQESSHPMQVYWAWLRRLYLNIEYQEDISCDICGKSRVISKYIFKTNKGYNYPKYLWRHPLSPYRKALSGEYEDKFLPIKMTVSGLPYTYWNDFVTTTEKQFPSQVISHHLKKTISPETQLIIWSFGFAMDSHSPLGWYESKTPLYLLEEKEQRQVFETEIDKYIQAANKISDNWAGYLVYAIKNAWFDESKDKNKVQKKSFNNDKAAEIAKCFWNNTESKFYELVKALYDNAHQLTDEKKVEFRRDWYEHIKNEAKKLFDRWAFRAAIQTNPRRIAKAHNQLIKSLNSKSLKQNILGLPKENK